MAISLKPEHLKRYKDIAGLIVKYGHGDLLKGAPVIDDPLEFAPEPPVPPEANDLAKDLEALGPTFIKFGQLLSTRADFIPPAYMEALSKLQDHIEPFPFEEVEAIVSVELGARLSKAFSEFDTMPLGTASLGQVHRAALRDGRQVAVKVQRPRIRDQVAEDLEAMQEIAGFIDAHTDLGRQYEFSKMVEELRKSLLRELDYRQEAANLRTIGKNMEAFEKIRIPQPVDDYSSGRVLTMDFVTGTKVTKISPLAKLEIDGAELAEQLFRAYLQQILVDGFFHADPHPGNVFITEDHEVALLDLGMVGSIGPALQTHLLKLLLAISEGQSDKAAEAAIRMGEPKEGFDEVQFRNRLSEIVEQQQTATVKEMQVGRIVMAVNRIAAECHIRVPAALTLLGKTLLNLDLVGRTLSPEFDPNESIRRNAVQIMHQRTMKSLSPGNLFSALVETKELIEHLPSRLNQLLELVSTNKLRLKVDTIDETLLLVALQKIANRITLGLILAALIIGAAMLMRVETTFRLFGYPGFAILCFLGASGGALVLVYAILRSDRHPK